MFVVSVFTFLVLVLHSFAVAQLALQSGSHESLLQYGSAQSVKTYLLNVSPEQTVTEVSLSTQDGKVLTSHEVSFSQVSQGLYNISVNLFFDGIPGEVQYRITAQTRASDGSEHREELSASHSVFGVVFYEEVQGERRLVSGDDSDGIHYTSFTTPESPARTFSAISHTPAGVILEGKSSIRAQTGSGASPLLLESDIDVSGDGMSVDVHPYRTGAVIVTVEFPELQVDGESHETVVYISVPNTPLPPVVVTQKGEKVVQIATNGTAELTVEMFNAESFPTMEAVLGSNKLEAIRDGSDIADLNQNVRFVGSVREEGTFPLRIRVKQEVIVDAVMLYEPSVVLTKAGTNQVIGGSPVAGIASNAGLVAGMVILAAVVLVAAVGGVMTVFWSRRRSEEAEANFDAAYSPAEDVGGFGIARDVYGRGSVEV